MITNNDLLDFHFVFCNIRLMPEYRMNETILSSLIESLDTPLYNTNKIRTILSKLDLSSNDAWDFAKHANVYAYIVPIKNKNVYCLLEQSLKYLLNCIKRKDYTTAIAAADVLHNLPIDICENRYEIPKSFYKKEVKWFRKKFDRNFLK